MPTDDATIFGLQLRPHFATWEELRDAAVLADASGWDVITTWDHFVPPWGGDGPNLEGWQIAAAFAAVTKRARIGVLVSCNTYRHPAVVANMVAALDHISNGRAILGLGAGWHEAEHRMYGLGYDPPGRRLARLDEAARIARGLLHEGRMTFSGRHYQLTDAVLSVRPVQDHIPILIGGGGERRTLRVAARYADWWHGAGSVDVIARKTDVLRAHCAAAGRDPARIRRTVGGDVVIGDAPDALARRAGQVRERTGVERPMAIAGSPRQIAALLARYHAVGVRGFVFGMCPPFDAATIERFMGDVKPLFAELTAAK